jgi:4-diphosphocytidyl-2-C-methyl-D-erythritol kinase
LTRQESGAKKITSCFQCLNDLEEVVFPAYPELARIKHDFFRQGAAAAVMSGSGASQIGLFRAQHAARNAAIFFQAKGMRAYCRMVSC